MRDNATISEYSEKIAGQHFIYQRASLLYDALNRYLLRKDIKHSNSSFLFTTVSQI